MKFGSIKIGLRAFEIVRESDMVAGRQLGGEAEQLFQRLVY